MTDNNALLETAVIAAIKAGRAIMEVYRTDFDVEIKSDDSPLTLADRRSHQIIVESLTPFDIPVLSEEGKHAAFTTRSKWDRLWVIDPLDGTKEFVKKNDEFTVNIALVEHRQPVIGVVYLPVKDILYFAAVNHGSYKLVSAMTTIQQHSSTTSAPVYPLEKLIVVSSKLPLANKTKGAYTIVGSRSHATPELHQFIEDKKEKYENVEFISAGSSLKICLVAEGAAHVYPRLGPTMEWDTAAGDAVARFSGAKVLAYNTSRPLQYNKADLLNPWFIVRNKLSGHTR
ncbi:MAG: 3'(2'),5'-bisphosphate nucleotidase CysQ [Desulfobacteraceae bacterium]|nr:3'(2'),5'-bisphosphate nucleotidase CysQ [Desulfobacteraceae bacterium]